ncbi:MAG: DUF2971 domain-containing protein [Chloroflexi bacterium]|nr:DUF2971 domain-containing protein [Chloroflexota bacterium]
MDVLYKYVNADRALTCLPDVGDGALRATQPQALNDPFECLVLPGTRRVSEAPSDEIAALLSSLNGTTPVSSDAVEKARRERGSLFLRDLLVEQLSQRYGIVSFTSNPLHPLMWAHYGNYGSGFAIGYDKAVIEQICHGNDCLREMRYGNNVIPLVVLDALNETNVNALLSTKGDIWQYEEEWRLIVELNETIGTGKPDQLGYPINLLRIPNEAVAKVCYTERTPAQVIDIVASRLSKANNRYRATRPIKLIATTGYGFDTAPEGA